MAALQRSVLPSVCSPSRPCATPCFRAGVSRPRLAARPAKRSTAAVRASSEVQDAQQRAAEERWENQIRDGTVKNVSAQDAGALMQEGWVLLDVRPPTEVERVAVSGAVTVPLFVPDSRMELGSLLANWAAFGTGGWWVGGGHFIPNTDFLAQVQAKVPKDAKVIVGCQKGLRSLAACEQLARAGYGHLAWINGGFDTARGQELPTGNGKDLRYAGIGGLSEALGWTEVQQEESRGFAGGYMNILKGFMVLLLLDALVFGYEQVNYMMGQH